MSIPKIILLVWFAFEVIALVLVIGRERKPVTPGVAVANLVIIGVLATLVVLA